MEDFKCLETTAIIGEHEFNSKAYDTILLVAHPDRPLNVAAKLSTLITNAVKCDPGLKTVVGVLSLTDHPAERLIYAPTGLLDPDYDDVRIIKETAIKGTKRALLSGSKKLLLIVEEFPEFENSELVAVLAVLETLYTPIHERERNPSKAKKLDCVALYTGNEEKTKRIVTLASIIESGSYACRDIGVGDPERMTPIKVQKYVEEMFSKTAIKLTVIDDPEVIKKEYPLFAAVDRGSVERHRGRIVYLEYTPPKEVNKTLILVGKGVCFDTGGAELKVGGAMLSMCRDKCGAAAVVGLMKIIEQYKPTHTKVIAALCLVRNSIGSNCYVSDEIIVSRAKMAVRTTNTDAEGRMAMADVLCKMKEIAVNAVDPHLFTIATLTGHASLTVGEGYSIVMDNGPAWKAGNSFKLQKHGEIIGDPFEISRFRKEDFEFHKGKTEGEDIHQGSNGPSTRSRRGHQGPAAFIVMASGLDKHGSGSEKPLKYTHMDISGRECSRFPGPPSAAPILAFINTYLLDNQI